MLVQRQLIGYDTRKGKGKGKGKKIWKANLLTTNILYYIFSFFPFFPLKVKKF